MSDPTDRCDHCERDRFKVGYDCCQAAIYDRMGWEQVQKGGPMASSNRGPKLTANFQVPQQQVDGAEERKNAPSMIKKLITDLRSQEYGPETSTSATRLKDDDNFVVHVDANRQPSFIPGKLEVGTAVHQELARKYTEDENRRAFAANIPVDKLQAAQASMANYTSDHYRKAWATGVSPAELVRRELLGTIPPLEAGRYVQDTAAQTPLRLEPIKFSPDVKVGLTRDQYARETIPSRYTPPLPARPIAPDPSGMSESDVDEPYTMPPAVKHRRRRVAQQEAREMLAFYGWVVSKDDGINLAQATRLKNLIAEGKVEKNG